MGAHQKEKLAPARLDALMKAADFKSDYALAKKLDVQPDQPGRWRRGITSPSSAVMVKLCDALNTTPGYLYGRSEEEERAALLDLVEKMFGRTARDLVAYTSRLTPHHRTVLAGQIRGWVEGFETFERLEHAPKPQHQIVEEPPLFPFDAERALAPVSAPRETEAAPASAPTPELP